MVIAIAAKNKHTKLKKEKEKENKTKNNSNGKRSKAYYVVTTIRTKIIFPIWSMISYYDFVDV